MLKKIIDAFYDFVDYGLFPSDRKEEKSSQSYILPNRNEEKAVSEHKNNFSDSYFDRHPYIGTSIICLIASLILWPAISIIGIVMFLLRKILIPYMIIINIIAFITVSKEKLTAGTVLSILGGFFGSLLALFIVQPDPKGIKIVSTACLWLFLCAVIPGSISLFMK